MNVLVAGHSGFLGTHLTRALGSVFTIQKVSLRDNAWEKTTENTDVYINLIGKAHDHNKTGNLKDYHNSNVASTKALYRSFLKSKATLFIQVSSIAAVEEIESEEPITELSTCHPISFYGKTKKQAENWLLNHTPNNQKKLIILRPVMVHGENDKGNLKLLYKLISKGVPYPFMKFNNKRSLLAVENFNFIVKQIILNQEKIPSGIYNLCDDEAIATKEIILAIERVTHKKVLKLGLPRLLVIKGSKLLDVVHLQVNSTQIKKLTSNLVVSNEKLKQALGVANLPINALEGIIKTVRHLHNHHTMH
ncbi:NAD-dependent epimerase/dehydratase family protein [Mangrovimonas aestuarii]|uniref:NAD-dependent epimerase/dehydratase family protein n=1 Tax=Mangrovimonas aestuarii TaxID=3018443 RepID=UPI0023783109|nr:NAD-dependent epimerase/dehydratase family protein [Mangrovimonas aestuarii]